ncbi:arginase family protein [Neolewinella lacunae]|uniref:Arginase family protein n=1 Tax=Neolewinella lacunae TaxID=1517758 RepID=A0A923PL16_9BACT|nr:arginase family protein [Neolewinella lacunae]MBC6996032.1 arginase family protein [Neolewinella lacunae]MDN3635421.1 arginase family protein [Neolewinella lacunae]
MPAHSVGKSLRPRSRQIAVAIIGLDAAVAQKTREHLYASSWAFGKLVVRDLGDIRKDTRDFIIPLLRELYAAGITPVLLGGNNALFAAQYLAFAELNRQVSLLQIDRCIGLNPHQEGSDVLDAAVYRPGRKQYHVAHLGAQQHLVDPAVWDFFDAHGFEAVRLGQARADVTQLEPLLRDADLVGLDISAINHNEAPARNGFHPSGFSLQEASQLAYYAGNSDKLSSFGLFGLNPAAGTTAETELTAAAYAQLVWYFLQGYSLRVGDFPATTKGLLEYIVDLQGFDRLTFWRSPRSNRWWVQVHDGKYQGEARHRLVPCAYQDYLLASNEQTLPDRLLLAMRRYTNAG